MKSANSRCSSVALSAVLLLPISSPSGQGAAPDERPGKSGVTSAAAKKEVGGSTIKVHGRWTITVRNADGSVAARHRFNNALTPDGATLLAHALNGASFVPTMWRVTLGSSGGNLPCADPNGARVACVLIESGDSVSVAHFATLTQAFGVLNGTARATFAGEITYVATHIRGQSSTQVSAEFTRHTLPQPITINAGQSIDVVVNISFS